MNIRTLRLYRLNLKCKVRAEFIDQILYYCKDLFTHKDMNTYINLNLSITDKNTEHTIRTNEKSRVQTAS